MNRLQPVLCVESMAVRADLLPIAGICGAAVADGSNVVDLKDRRLKERRPQAGFSCVD